MLVKTLYDDMGEPMGLLLTSAKLFDLFQAILDYY